MLGEIVSQYSMGSSLLRHVRSDGSTHETRRLRCDSSCQLRDRRSALAVGHGPVMMNRADNPISHRSPVGSPMDREASPGFDQPQSFMPRGEHRDVVAGTGESGCLPVYPRIRHHRVDDQHEDAAHRVSRRRRRRAMR